MKGNFFCEIKSKCYYYYNKSKYTHVSLIQSLANALDSFADKVSEELIQTKILMTLPSYYK